MESMTHGMRADPSYSGGSVQPALRSRFSSSRPVRSNGPSISHMIRAARSMVFGCISVAALTIVDCLRLVERLIQSLHDDPSPLVKLKFLHGLPYPLVTGKLAAVTKQPQTEIGELITSVIADLRVIGHPGAGTALVPCPVCAIQFPYARSQWFFHWADVAVVSVLDRSLPGFPNFLRLTFRVAQPVGRPHAVEAPA